jgi:hypothetical protein
MKKVFALGLLLVVSTPAFAWNDKGHMVTARLAWRRLTEEERSKILEILRKHPHYDEFLSAKRPNGFSEDEWVFLRAATWPDWVRKHHKAQYHHAPWHYINYPFVPPGSRFDPERHQPRTDKENIVNRLPVCVNKIKEGSDRDKAIYLCWLLHLVGDIHQPLHCTAMFSEEFASGDKGGNLALVRVRTSQVKLHTMWDGLLGKALSASSIGRDTAAIEKMLQADPALVKEDVERNQTFESWAKESFELAKTAAYLNGDLKVSNADDDVDDDDIPDAPDDYAHNAGRTARIQIGKAGLRLAEQIRQLCR